MRTLVWDGLILAGGLTIAVGFGIAWVPLGFIVGGAELLAVGVAGAWAFGRNKGNLP